MPQKKSSGSRKKSGRKYGKAAGKSVESAMRRKKRHASLGKRWQRRSREEPEASDCHWTLRSPRERRKSAKEKVEIAATDSHREPHFRLE